MAAEQPGEADEPRMVNGLGSQLTRVFGGR
jgi:hypothetical protein